MPNLGTKVKFYLVPPVDFEDSYSLFTNYNIYCNHCLKFKDIEGYLLVRQKNTDRFCLVSSNFPEDNQEIYYSYVVLKKSYPDILETIELNQDDFIVLDSLLEKNEDLNRYIQTITTKYYGNSISTIFDLNYSVGYTLTYLLDLKVVSFEEVYSCLFLRDGQYNFDLDKLKGFLTRFFDFKNIENFDRSVYFPSEPLEALKLLWDIERVRELDFMGRIAKVNSEDEKFLIADDIYQIWCLKNHIKPNTILFQLKESLPTKGDLPIYSFDANPILKERYEYIILKVNKTSLVCVRFGLMPKHGLMSYQSFRIVFSKLEIPKEYSVLRLNDDILGSKFKFFIASEFFDVEASDYIRHTKKLMHYQIINYLSNELLNNDKDKKDFLTTYLKNRCEVSSELTISRFLFLIFCFFKLDLNILSESVFIKEDDVSKLIVDESIYTKIEQLLTPEKIPNFRSFIAGELKNLNSKKLNTEVLIQKNPSQQSQESEILLDKVLIVDDSEILDYFYTEFKIISTNLNKDVEDLTLLNQIAERISQKYNLDFSFSQTQLVLFVPGLNIFLKIKIFFYQETEKDPSSYYFESYTVKNKEFKAEFGKVLNAVEFETNFVKIEDNDTKDLQDISGKITYKESITILSYIKNYLNYLDEPIKIEGFKDLLFFNLAMLYPEESSYSTESLNFIICLGFVFLNKEVATLAGKYIHFPEVTNQDYHNFLEALASIIPVEKKESLEFFANEKIRIINDIPIYNSICGKYDDFIKPPQPNKGRFTVLKICQNLYNCFEHDFDPQNNFFDFQRIFDVDRPSSVIFLQTQIETKTASSLPTEVGFNPLKIKIKVDKNDLCSLVEEILDNLKTSEINFQDNHFYTFSDKVGLLEFIKNWLNKIQEKDLTLGTLLTLLLPVMYIVFLTEDWDKLNLLVTYAVKNESFDTSSFVEILKQKVSQQKVAVISEKISSKLENYDLASVTKKLTTITNISEESKLQLLDLTQKYKDLSDDSYRKNISKTIIDYIFKLPFDKIIADKEINLVKKSLEEKIYGLENVKNLIIANLAKKVLSPQANSKIICLYGSPGVGKTYFCRELAQILDRPYFNIPAGSLQNSEILRGSQKFWSGSDIGVIAKDLINGDCMNPIIVIDEIDKIASASVGGSASVIATLLEMFDPNQNSSFRENFLEIGLDLSKVWFFCTANNLKNIHAALLDRLELVEVKDYSFEEKLEIFDRFVWLKNIQESGLEKDKIEWEIDCKKQFVGSFSEPGIRSLDKGVAYLCGQLAIKKVLNQESLEELKITQELIKELSKKSGLQNSSFGFKVN